MSRMDEDSEEENSSPLDSVLGEIKQLERHIALADYELLKEQVKRFEALYVQRDELVSKFPDFWLRVFEFFFDSYSSIETPNIEDFDLLAHLKSFKVSRNTSEPKEVDFVFTFAPNDYLADDSLILRKSFSNIQSPDSASQITSNKVPIKWRSGKDLTKMVKGAPPSFFSWFAFEGKGHGGEEFPDSADIAVALADEIYPHAHKIYQESVMEESDEVDEDEDLENSDEEEEEEDDDDSQDSDAPPAKKRRKDQ